MAILFSAKFIQQEKKKDSDSSEVPSWSKNFCQITHAWVTYALCKKKKRNKMQKELFKVGIKMLLKNRQEMFVKRDVVAVLMRDSSNNV